MKIPRIIEDACAKVRREVAAHRAIKDPFDRYGHLSELSGRAHSVVMFLSSTAGEARDYLKTVHDDDLDMVAMMSDTQRSAVKNKLVAARLKAILKEKSHA
jgi:hypothetical protein